MRKTITIGIIILLAAFGFGWWYKNYKNKKEVVDTKPTNTNTGTTNTGNLSTGNPTNGSGGSNNNLPKDNAGAGNNPNNGGNNNTSGGGKNISCKFDNFLRQSSLSAGNNTLVCAD